MTQVGLRARVADAIGRGIVTSVGGLLAYIARACTTRVQLGVRTTRSATPGGTRTMRTVQVRASIVLPLRCRRQ